MHFTMNCYNPVVFALLQRVADVGIVESITLKNFMCHSLLGPFTFGSNVNFVVGSNGSECGHFPLSFCICLISQRSSYYNTSSCIELSPNSLYDRWKECCSDSSHSCSGRECTGHKQRILSQGFCKGRREVSPMPHLVTNSYTSLLSLVKDWLQLPLGLARYYGIPGYLEIPNVWFLNTDAVPSVKLIQRILY